jgi:hypothetical protein
MKKAITFFVILFFCLTSTQAQFTFTNHTPILSWKWISQTTQDSQGNIWAVGEDGSLLKYDGSTWDVMTIPGFTNITYSSIEVIDGNNIWVGSGVGLFHYDGSTWTNYNTSNSMLPNDAVNNIKIDSNGDIWVATYLSGVTVISGSTWTIYDESNNLPDGSVGDIEFDANGDVWLGNDNYIVRKSGNTWTEWIISDLNGHWASRINDLDFASNGDIYAATSKGIIVFDGTTWSTTQYLDGSWTTDYSYNSLAIDDDDRIWLAKSNYGLLIHDITLDTLIGSFDNLDYAAIPSGQLFDIFVDSDNAKWLVGAGGGISEITAITFALPLSLASTKTDVLCNGDATGSINLVLNGGTSPFTYAWSDNSLSGANLTNLPAGTYEVTVTDSLSETISEAFTILEPQALAGTTSTTAEQNTNGNGSAMVNASGGVSPYTYLWNDANNQTTPEAINLSAGDYLIVVTDANGCILEETITVETVVVPLTLTSTKTDIACNGDTEGSITITVDGGATPYTYTWSDISLSGSILTNLPAGNYEVTVTDNASVVLSEIFTIQEPPVLEGTTTSIPEEDTNGNGSAMVNASGGVLPYVYLWNDPNNQTTAEAINLSAGDYLVTITDANGCTLEETVTVDMVTDINNISEEEINVQISPNPITNYFNIEVLGMGDKILLTILSVEGKLMKEQNLGKGLQQTIYVVDMNSGFYIIQIQDENGKIYSEKIMVGK